MLISLCLNNMQLCPGARTTRPGARTHGGAPLSSVTIDSSRSSSASLGGAAPGSCIGATAATGAAATAAAAGAAAAAAVVLHCSSAQPRRAAPVPDGVKDWLSAWGSAAGMRRGLRQSCVWSGPHGIVDRKLGVVVVAQRPWEQQRSQPCGDATDHELLLPLCAVAKHIACI